MFPCSNVIAKARSILQDEDPVAYRDSDPKLIGWINDCLGVMVDLRPDLFVQVVDHTCSAGAVQTLSGEVRKIVDVPRIVGGPAIFPASRTDLDAFNPGWQAEASGAAKNWMPHADITKFYLTPPAAISQHVEVHAVRPHAALDDPTDSILLPLNYAPAVVAFVVNRAESKDDEHINSNRAAAFMSDFAGMIGAGKA